MSLYNTDIQGNANISRNANVGSHANVNGDVVVGHNLFVKGWVDAPNIKGPCKGLYASEEALKAAYPRPMPGWFALVGNTLPAQVWRTDGGQWVPTGETGGQFNLWLDQLETDVKDLTDDVRDLEELLDNGLLLGETIAFTSTGTAAAMTFTVMMRDGSIKPYSKPIPIVTAEKAGMMSAADKKELSAATTAITSINTKIATLERTTSNLRQALDKEISDRETADTNLAGRITDEATNRKKGDDALQALIAQLRKEFDTLVGENASEAIDNFTEVVAFLDGLKDTDKLSTKLADLSSADVKLSEDVLELQKEVWPLIVEFKATPTIIKAGVETSINLTWNAKRKGKDITAEAVMTLDGEETAGGGKTMNMTLSHRQSRTVSLKTEYAGMTETRSCGIRGTLPTYFGTVPKIWTADEDNILALSELIIGDRALSRTNITTDDGKIALAYPKDFGALTSVKDGNGYEVLPSYSVSEVRVNGIQYYLYLLSVAVTASGVTQIYK